MANYLMVPYLGLKYQLWARLLTLRQKRRRKAAFFKTTLHYPVAHK